MYDFLFLTQSKHELQIWTSPFSLTTSPFIASSKSAPRFRSIIVDTGINPSKICPLLISPKDQQNNTHKMKHYCKNFQSSNYPIRIDFKCG